MKFQKFTALLLAALLVLSLAACGTKNNDKKADMSSNDSAMTDEPKNAEEALALHKKLMEQENTILSLLQESPIRFQQRIKQRTLHARC